MATSAPASANTSAISRPMLTLPPVTSALRPRIEKRAAICCALLRVMSSRSIVHPRLLLVLCASARCVCAGSSGGDVRLGVVGHARQKIVLGLFDMGAHQHGCGGGVAPFDGPHDVPVIVDDAAESAVVVAVTLPQRGDQEPVTIYQRQRP